jgi:hypothetical protein
MPPGKNVESPMSNTETETRPWRATRIAEKRRGVRMNSRVPIGVEWESSEGKKSRHRAFTCVVSSNGCLVVLPEDLPLEQQVRVVNLVNEQILSGVVVWKGSQREEGWELGIELTQPPMDFWGLEL